jgi:transcriptional regulator with XRE-family HTH domain
LLNTALAKQRREQMGLSLAELGGLVGVDASTLFRWEAGEREPRTTDKLADYARVLGVSVDDLLAEPPEGPIKEAATP